MAKQTHFFVSKNDLVAAAARVDEAINLKFVRNGFHNSKLLDTYLGLLAIPSLGTNVTGLPVGAGSYLVLRDDDEVPIKEVITTYGAGRQYRFDMSAHQRWFYFEPGGETSTAGKRKFVIGKAGTNLPSKESAELYAVFKKWFIKGFQKGEHGAAIGPDAFSKAGQYELVW